MIIRQTILALQVVTQYITIYFTWLMLEALAGSDEYIHPDFYGPIGCIVLAFVASILSRLAAFHQYGWAGLYKVANDEKI